MTAKRYDNLKDKVMGLLVKAQCRACLTAKNIGEKVDSEKGSMTVELAVITGFLVTIAILFVTVFRPVVEDFIRAVAQQFTETTNS